MVNKQFMVNSNSQMENMLLNSLVNHNETPKSNKIVCQICKVCVNTSEHTIQCTKCLHYYHYNHLQIYFQTIKHQQLVKKCPICKMKFDNYDHDRLIKPNLRQRFPVTKPSINNYNLKISIIGSINFRLQVALEIRTSVRLFDLR